MQNETQERWLQVPQKGSIRVVCNNEQLLKVSATTIPPKTAGKIAWMIKNGSSSVDIQAIGAGAVNQATKAIATAIGWLEESGIRVACNIVFKDITVEGEKELRTAMCWTVFVI